jgi:hypothetical protein
MEMRDLSSSDPGRLANLLKIDEHFDPAWSPADLKAILIHQLSASVMAELRQARLKERDAADAAVVAAVPQSLTFADLLNQPNPPLALLGMVKSFAKSLRLRRNSPLPPEVATALYYAAIAAALLRHRHRLSKLDDSTLADGFRWASVQEWIPEGMRLLFEAAIGHLSPPPSA